MAALQPGGTAACSDPTPPLDLHLQDTKRAWHASPAFKPLVFIDVKGTVSLFQLV